MARTRTAKHPRPVEPEDESQEEPEEEAVRAEQVKKGSISKSEAARQAIAAGLDSPEEATEFIRKKFGIEMSKPHFSAPRVVSVSVRKGTTFTASGVHCCSEHSCRPKRPSPLR